MHGFRVLVARWSSLLLTTEESLWALKDLAGQAEEFSRVFVEFDRRRPLSDYRAEQLQLRQQLWGQAFANAVVLEEALIDKGGERSTAGGPFHTPGRLLLPPADRRALEERGTTAASLRLYSEDAAARPSPA